MNNITNIAIDELQHHPDNPRKDYGDLEELAESIKASGVMQNLTVVRSDDGTGLYDVIIGNRRLEAAKLAGLDELPCVVVDLSPQEQMATMLAENMQRADLTILEQAQGFQYMLDLGESTKSISEKTGFSASTVRRRVKLLELDTEKLEAAFNKRQVSLEDVDKINSIEDINERNRLLDVVGTGNFGWSFNSAKSKQEQKELHDKVRRIMCETELEEVAEGMQWGPKATKEQVGAVNLEAAKKNDKSLQKAVDEGIKAYKSKSDSYALSYSYLYFFAEKKTQVEKEEIDTKAELEKARRTKNAAELKTASENAYKLRHDFIEKYPKTQAKKHLKELIIGLARHGVEFEEEAAEMSDPGFYDFDSEMFMKLSNINGENEQTFTETVEKAVSNCPEKLLLSLAYAAFNDNERNSYVGWYKGYADVHSESELLDGLYRFLVTLGYQMSDDEKALQDGSHSLFFKPESSNEK